ncbi:methylated-DNA-[protein]-cysteine S-methyltransferase [Hydrogenoanaerobacterium saccharovorans]|uniref:Methylated-DNA--protein-cysteine methyltransferase n=1 Tax=Hydrogenoanaerobacterium saccharovorans TaxID=474960 RepID=A0A1H8DSX6_9FIRM|nr:methylated-DNA--[protein]-cysteine S-methyltransferase [Hydrogenoanaerobacterium saccharovorans]RPF42377.1 methylated-DNA-[protein]-cysteine S-methyltransferase [Hydrogenoanaerobacterium saccharovorans]SEN10372.1 methylated-DNA-[protein]-cysteine S-methyltransferase [Hydrogenoanaerobacterium saccharovorans]
MKAIWYYDTPIGKVAIAEKEGSITNLYFETDSIPQERDFAQCETDVIKEAHRQLQAYLAGTLQEFSLPLAPAGTPFMQQVWQCLCQIPYGATASYKQIAQMAGNSKACRAVGLANNKNPIPLFIPCHRVVGSSGKLVGYRGGLDLKKKLLALEKVSSIVK